MDKIREKIEAKQWKISTNYDLSGFGYVRCGTSTGKQQWKNDANNLIQKYRALVRNRDSHFFNTICGTKYMRKYEIDHDWENGETVTLKTPEEHRNDKNGKPSQYNWIETEEWLQELYPGKRQ